MERRSTGSGSGASNAATVEIRTAGIGDLPALRTIFRRASWANVGDRPLLTEHPEFLELSDDGVREGRTVVASVEGRVVGFATVAGTGRCVELEDVFVDPSAMRRGVGRALVSEVADRAARSGVVEIQVDANSHSLAFYEATGFVAIREVALEHGTATQLTLAIRPDAELPRPEAR